MSRFMSKIWSLKDFGRGGIQSHASRTIDPTTWQTLLDLNIAAKKLTKRGCRAGFNKVRSIKTVIGNRLPSDLTSSTRQIFSTANRALFQQPFSLVSRSCCRRRVNLSNLSYIKAQAENTNRGEKRSIKHFVPSLMLTNAMSLAPKIDEVRSVILDSNLDLACITETWLKDTVNDNAIHIPGYKLVRKDRTFASHGGICVYIRVEFQCFRLDAFESDNAEVLYIKYAQEGSHGEFHAL